jgi:hypothetical protein
MKPEVGTGPNDHRRRKTIRGKAKTSGTLFSPVKAIPRYPRKSQNQ